eukprot:72044_1
MAQLKNTDDKQPKFHSIDSVHSASASGTSTIQNAINELKPIKTECNAGPTLTSIDTTLDALNAQLSSNSKRIEHSYYNPLTHWGNVSSLRNPYQEYDAPRNANLKQNNNSRNQSYQNKMDKHHLEHMLFSAPDDAQSPQKQRMRQILQKRATKKSQNSQSLPKRSTAHDDDGSKYYLTEITDDHKHRKKKKRNNQRARNKRQMKKKSKKQLKNTQLHVKKQKQASKSNRNNTGHKTESDRPAIASNDQTDRLPRSDRILKPHEILQNEVGKVNREYMEIAKSSHDHPLKAHCDDALEHVVAAECKMTPCEKEKLNATTMLQMEMEVMQLQRTVMELRRKHEDEMKAMAENENAKREQMRLGLLAKSKGEKDALNIKLNAVETKMYLIQNECKSLRMQNEELQAENQRLQAMDKSKYLSWSCEDVGRWIVSLNPDYTKYEQRLFIELAEEGITGNTLRYVKMSDIKDWGIKNIMNRQHVFESIMKLVGQGQTQAVNEAEGNTAPTAYI